MFPSLNTFFLLSCEIEDMGRQIKAGLARNGEGLCSKDGEADREAGIEDRGHRPHAAA